MLKLVCNVQSTLKFKKEQEHAFKKVDFLHGLLCLLFYFVLVLSSSLQVKNIVKHRSYIYKNAKTKEISFAYWFWLRWKGYGRLILFNNRFILCYKLLVIYQFSNLLSKISKFYENINNNHNTTYKQIKIQKNGMFHKKNMWWKYSATKRKSC